MSTLPAQTPPRKIFFLFKPLYRIPGAAMLVLRRLQFHPALTLLALLGIVLAVGMITNASFFSTAVDRVILLQELQAFSQTTGRPPFSTSAYLFPSTRKPLKLEAAERASRNIAEIISDQVRLPLRHIGLEVSSGSMLLQPDAKSVQVYGETFIKPVKSIYMQDIAEHMQITAGEPLDENGRSTDVMDLWVHERLAQETGMLAGETFTIRFDLSTPPIPVRVAGLWRAADAGDSSYWFVDPDYTLKDALLVRRADYIQFIQPGLSAGTREANWYVILDENRLDPKDGQVYVKGYQQAQKMINEFLPGIKLNMPPLTPLKSFVVRSQTLTTLLLSYNLPAFGILLYFLVLIAGVIAQWQRRETAMLVSRGMSVSGVMNLVLTEQMLLILVGLPLGIGFGMLIARAMGYTSSFLVFTQREALPVSLEGLNPALTLLALALSLLARLLPVLGAARQSVVTEEREWTRPQGGPFWYRYYLDLLLIIPTYYAYDQMFKSGALSNLIKNRPEDILQDPLLILVPALFVITASLVTMRLFALIMRLIDLVAGLTPWLTLHLALRQLGRQSQDYIHPLLLVLISLGLGVYTLSMAASLDQWLVHRVYYQVGADLTFTPRPNNLEAEIPGDGNWIPAPQEFLKIDGVQHAARVATYPARVTLPEGQAWGNFMAIDRLDFPQVAWYRFDFAREPLGALMNRLAAAPGGILISQLVLELSGAQLGDEFSMIIDLSDTLRLPANFTIVGTYDYFPTVYEEQEGFTVVGSMDELTALLGFIPPHDIWLDLAPGVSSKSVTDALARKTGVINEPLLTNDAAALVAAEQAKKERVGIFGTLTIGFLATAGMAILGLLTFSFASLRERVYRFAVLNSIGLLRRQIMQQVMLEYAFLALFGALGGTLIGMYAAEIFIPFFRFTGGRGTPLPPMLPVIAEGPMRTLAIVFTIIIVLIEVISITSALRRRLVRIR